MAAAWSPGLEILKVIQVCQLKVTYLGENQQTEPYRLHAPLGLRFEHALESPGGLRLLGSPPEFQIQQAQEFVFLLNS